MIGRLTGCSTGQAVAARCTIASVYERTLEDSYLSAVFYLVNDYFSVTVIPFLTEIYFFHMQVGLKQLVVEYNS